MKAISSDSGAGMTPVAWDRLLRAAAGVWDYLFGPPRMHTTPDGAVTARLLGRRFEAATPESLFDLVARERERLLIQVGRMHEGVAAGHVLGGSRFTDSYHHHTRRIEDRVALYTAFLGRMAKDLGIE
ncbi:MAG: hypothetical protein ACRDJ9_23385 [Dehalococcoidia bacterium]